jgi:hypothetical protein
MSRDSVFHVIVLELRISSDDQRFVISYAILDMGKQITNPSVAEDSLFYTLCIIKSGDDVLCSA